MTDFIQPNDGHVFDLPGHRVYTRAHWQDEWTLRPGVYCDWVRFQSAPELPSAQLAYRYGIVKDAGEYDYAFREKLNLTRQYVKVEIDQTDLRAIDRNEDGEPDPIVWHGIVEEPADALEGVVTRRRRNPDTQEEEDQRIETGAQVFGCFGLEILLRRTAIDRSICVGIPPGAEAPTDPGDNGVFEIGRALTFNDPKLGASGNQDPKPNRSPEKGPEGVYLFESQPAVAKFWTTRDIFEYLTTYFQPFHPFNEFGQSQVPLGPDSDTVEAWVEGADDELQKIDRPVIECQGRDVYEVLSTLLDRRRMTGWLISTVDSEVQTNGLDTLRLLVYRLNDRQIEMGTAVLPANPRETALEFDRALDVDTAVLRESETSRYDRIRVRGARKRTMLTLGFNPLGSGGNLVGAWDDGDQQTYNVGASNSIDYPSADAYIQEQRNKRVRDSEALKDVFSLFRLGAGWFGTDHNNEEYFPGSPPLYMPGLRFLRRLLRPAFGATDTKEMAPLVMVNVGNEEKSYWELGHKLASEFEFSAEGEPLGRSWSLSLEMADDAPALSVRVNGAPQHVIAKSFFVPLDVDEPPELDYSDNKMLATVAFELDEYVEVVEGLDNDWDADVLRELVIDLGGRARLDWIAPDTIIDCRDGVVYSEPDGRYFRDDRDRMRDIARLAAEWHDKPRQAVTLTIAQAFGRLKVGDLLTKFGEQDQEREVNAVVTSVEITLFPQHRTTITTAYSELDYTDLFETFGGHRK